MPAHADALRNLGAIAARAGRADEAVEQYQRAASAAPSDANAQRDLGEVLLQAGALGPLGRRSSGRRQCDPETRTWPICWGPRSSAWAR